MTDVGIIGLDTSHAESFASIIDERADADVTAVWDGGDVRNEGHIRQFCDRYDAKRFDEPHELIPDVNAVLILTVDWNTHYDLAVPFLKHDVPTLIDKPVGGCIDHIEDIRDAATGTPFFGGSAIAYHPELQKMALDPAGQTLYCLGYNDPFYYGAHLVDALYRMVDGNWTCAVSTDHPGKTVDIVFSGDTYVTIRLDNPTGREQFSFLRPGTRSQSVRIGNSEAELLEMYRSYLDTFFDTVSGSIDVGDRVLDAAELLLGVHATLECDRPITPDCDYLDDYNVASDAFLEEYPSKTYVSDRAQTNHKSG